MTTVEPRPSWRRANTLLAAVAVVHAASPLVALGAHLWFGVDETVYLSQLNRHVPAGLFSPPRARGATLIAAPVTMLTTSVVAVRVWVAALSAIALYLGFRPWLRTFSGYTVPLAAALLSSIWTVIFYGFAVMPNEFVAFLVLAATGCLINWFTTRSRRDLAFIASALALTALLRPSDAGYAAVGLVLASFVIPAQQGARLRAAFAVLGGTVIGCLDWIIEAETSYGGLRRRIQQAQAEQGGGGLHFAGAAQARALAGPVLCRGTCHVHASLLYQAWWIAALALLVGAVVAAHRHGDTAVVLPPVCVAAVMAVQYVFTVPYAAPRFLIPTYALLSVPCASTVGHLVRAVATKTTRYVLTAALTGVLAAHVAIQVSVLTSHITPGFRVFTHGLFADADVLRHQLHHPCVIVGYPQDSQEFAYATACINGTRSRSAITAEIAAGDQVVWLDNQPPTWLGDDRPAILHDVTWRHVTLPFKSAAEPHFAYISNQSKAHQNRSPRNRA